MKTLLFTAIALISAAHRAGAEMVPEDPYADHDPSASKAPVPALPATATAAAPAVRTRLEPPQTASAADTIIAVGSVTFESGPLPPPFDTDPRLAGFCAGYVCDVVGVFGTYFNIEGCRPAAIHGITFDDASKPVVSAVQARYPGPVISCWAAHGWKLSAIGVVVLVFGWIVWRLMTRTSRRAARRRRTMFHLSAIDPSVATNHTAAWEHQPLPLPLPQAQSQPQPQPQPQAQPQPQPAAPPAMTCYGPYGRVAATPGPMTTPYTFTSMTYAHAAPSGPAATPDDLRKTRQDASYHAYVEREHAIQLARGSQSDELEPTRRRPALHSSAVNRPEPPALRATRLRHPPVPKPPQLTMLSHMPNRLS